MSILYPLLSEEIQEEFNVRGWFLGIVPVYALMDEETPDEFYLVERNGIPEWTIPITAAIWTFGIWVLNLGGIFKGIPRRYPIMVTGYIHNDEEGS